MSEDLIANIIVERMYENKKSDLVRFCTIKTSGGTRVIFNKYGFIYLIY